MQQKKFSTMLTLKIINVFLADGNLRREGVGKAAVKGGEMRSEEEKRREGGKVPEVEMRSLSTGRADEREGKRMGPVRQCTSASSAEGRASLQCQPPPQGGRGVAEEVVRRRGEEVHQRGGEGGAVRRRREEVGPTVGTAHKLQIENKKAQGSDRTPTPGRRDQPGKRREVEKRVEEKLVMDGRRKESLVREEEGRRNKGKDTSTRDSLRQ